MKMISYGTAAACIGAVLLLAGCAAQKPHQQQTDPSKPVLRVGVSAIAPPMIFAKSGDYTGIEAELAAGLAAQLGMSLQFVDCPWDELIPRLLEKKFDIIMSGMTITSERSVLISFTEPYLLAGQKCLVRNEHKNKFPTLGTVQFTNMRVGAEKGTTGEFLVQRNLSLAKKESFLNPERGAQALIDKKIDMFISDGPIIWWLAAIHETKGLTVLPFFLTEDYIAWGVRKDDVKLKNAADQFVRSLKDSGRLKKILQRWIPNAF